MYSKADQHRGNFLFSSSFFLISPSGLNKAVKMKNNSSAYPKKWDLQVLIYFEKKYNSLRFIVKSYYYAKLQPFTINIFIVFQYYWRISYFDISALYKLFLCLICFVYYVWLCFWWELITYNLNGNMYKATKFLPDEMSYSVVDGGWWTNQQSKNSKSIFVKLCNSLFCSLSIQIPTINFVKKHLINHLSSSNVSVRCL